MADKEERSGFYFRVGQGDTIMQEVLAYFQNQGWGKLTTATRNGLRLIWDLSHSRTDVLEELFPFVRNHYCGDQDPDERKKIIEETVKSMMKQQSRPAQQDASLPPPPAGYPLMKQSGSGIGTLGAGRPITLPVFDDDDENTIVLNKAVYNNGQAALDAIFKIAF